jgi:hypothetical protein
LDAIVTAMNKRSVTKKRPIKPARSTARRKASARRARSAVRQPEVNGAATVQIAAITVAQVTAIGSGFHTHRFQVGQTVFYTSSPISRPGASGSYKVVRLLPSDGDDYQYRIKNPGEAFERVAKESQLELEG